MKILVTGKDGQVGYELQRALAPLGELTAVGREECDLTSADAIRRLVRDIAPDIIVNAAAYTAVDKAQSQRDTAFAVNGDAPRIFGEEAARNGALVIHYSTDYVFDGSKDGAYAENDRPSPQNVYGESKLAGEHGLIASTDRHLILRTSWVFGAYGGNFAKTILRLAKERDQLSIVNDQFGSPTSAALIADVTAHLVGRHARASEDFPYGIYHLASEGCTNWFDYARLVLREAEAAGVGLKLSAGSLGQIPTREYPTPAQRPLNSRLDSTLLCSTFGLRLPSWDESVRHMLKLLLN